MHLRKRARPEKPGPANFEMIPNRGLLPSGQYQNVQIKFMPTEQVTQKFDTLYLSRVFSTNY